MAVRAEIGVEEDKEITKAPSKRWGFCHGKATKRFWNLQLQGGVHYHIKFVITKEKQGQGVSNQVHQIGCQSVPSTPIASLFNAKERISKQSTRLPKRDVGVFAKRPRTPNNM
ncbi:MAG: hypothetical protein FWD76_06450 [Firmicutes bacterium]|nr:hypothetical protein [Bacillota bacterium]